MWQSVLFRLSCKRLGRRRTPRGGEIPFRQPQRGAARAKPPCRGGLRLRCAPLRMTGGVCAKRDAPAHAGRAGAAFPFSEVAVAGIIVVSVRRRGGGALHVIAADAAELGAGSHLGAAAGADELRRRDGSGRRRRGGSGCRRRGRTVATDAAELGVRPHITAALRADESLYARLYIYAFARRYRISMGIMFVRLRILDFSINL